MMEEQAYKIYVTDALKAVVENISKIGGGNTMKNRFVEMLPKLEIMERDTTKDAQNIIDRIKGGINAL